MADGFNVARSKVEALLEKRLLSDAYDIVRDLLTRWDEVAAPLAAAFGPDLTYESFAAAISNLEADAWPTIRIADARLLHGARGAYAASSDTIYLSRQYLMANASDPRAIQALLLEEIGHALDARLESPRFPRRRGRHFLADRSRQIVVAYCTRCIAARE